ncbi:MAG: FtsQ-type POTRA domain-containing protein [Deltaproteobacteria bacterium]|nr:FtsQ-type POTRA domain-containing protein [Deltaproteobacteria bacterium]
MPRSPRALPARLSATRPKRRRRSRASNRKKRGPLLSREGLGRFGLRLARTARRGAPLGLLALGLGVVGTGAYAGVQWATHSPRFSLVAAEVRGLHNMPHAELEQALEPVMGGNLFRTDTDAVERRLELLPWIEDAEVSRRLPNRLLVEVVEEEPAVMVSLGGLYLADDRGRVFKRANTATGEGLGLVVVTGLERHDYRADPASAQQLITSARRLADSYRLVMNRPKLGEVHIDSSRGFALVLAESGARIHCGFGRVETLEARLLRFDAAWAALSPDERAKTRNLYIDNETREDSVTIAFAGAR